MFCHKQHDYGPGNISVGSPLKTEEDIKFERYSGREYKFVKMNLAYDKWENWVPTNPSEQMLKNTIDSNEHIRSERVGRDDF